MRPELERAKTNFTAEGDYISVRLNDIETFNRALEQGASRESLGRLTTDDLPPPLSYADIHINGHKEDRLPLKFNSVIGFPRPRNTDENWKDIALTEIEGRIGNDATNSFVNSGDPLRIDDALFIRLDNDTYVGVNAVSELGQSEIRLKTVSREKIVENTDQVIDDIEFEYDKSPGEKLQSFIACHVHAIDSITQTQAKDTESIERALIEINPPATYYPKVIEAAVKMPEAEMRVSNEHSLAMIGGMESAKQEIEKTISIFRDREAAQIYGISPSNFVLHGPPGTGKTTLVNALAHELDAELMSIPSTKIVDRFIGESGKNVERMFLQAIKQSQDRTQVMFFDEIDALINARESRHTERSDVVKVLNANITKIQEKYSDRIIIAGATNVDIDDLEPSIMRSGRLKPIGVPLPSEEERTDIWAVVMAKDAFKASSESSLSFVTVQDKEGASHAYIDGADQYFLYDNSLDTGKLAKMTDGMTGADFEQIIKNARYTAYCAYRANGKRELVKINQSLLETEIKNFHRR